MAEHEEGKSDQGEQHHYHKHHVSITHYAQIRKLVSIVGQNVLHIFETINPNLSFKTYPCPKQAFTIPMKFWTIIAIQEECSLSYVIVFG